MCLSIVILFCDKDVQFVPNLLETIDKKVKFEHQYVLVDNREKNTDYYEFTRYNIALPCGEEGDDNYIVIQNHKNLGQLCSKKKALKKCKGDYVWFIDADDKPFGYIYPYVVNNVKNEDVLVFNYAMTNERGEPWTPYFIEKEKRINDTSKFRDWDFVYKYCVACWNKWFKKSLLDKVFEDIPDDVLISCSEDTFITASAYLYADSVRLLPYVIYDNYPNNGYSNCRKITNSSQFKMILQGYSEIIKLYEKRFNDSNFKNESEQIGFKGLINYFIYSIQRSDKSIWKDELEMLIDEVEDTDKISYFFSRNIMAENCSETVVEIYNLYLTMI